VLLARLQNHPHQPRPIAEDVESRVHGYRLQCGFTQLGIFERSTGEKMNVPR
jgi:hypothetical protein